MSHKEFDQAGFDDFLNESVEHSDTDNTASSSLALSESGFGIDELLDSQRRKDERYEQENQQQNSTTTMSSQPNTKPTGLSSLAHTNMTTSLSIDLANAEKDKNAPSAPSPQMVVCDICSSKADVFCEECNLNFCNSEGNDCDQDMHDGPHSDHIRVPIGNKSETPNIQEPSPAKKEEVQPDLLRSEDFMNSNRLKGHTGLGDSIAVNDASLGMSTNSSLWEQTTSFNKPPVVVSENNKYDELYNSGRRPAKTSLPPVKESLISSTTSLTPAAETKAPIAVVTTPAYPKKEIFEECEFEFQVTDEKIIPLPPLFRHLFGCPYFSMNVDAPLTVKETLSIIDDIYALKGEFETLHYDQGTMYHTHLNASAGLGNGQEHTFPDIVLDYFLRKYKNLKSAKTQLSVFIISVGPRTLLRKGRDKFVWEQIRIRRFAHYCGMYGSHRSNPESLSLYSHVFGLFQQDEDDVNKQAGVLSMPLARSIVQDGSLNDVFKTKKEYLVNEVMELGSSENEIQIDDYLEIIMKVWLTEYQYDINELQMIYCILDYDQTNCIDFNTFKQVLKGAYSDTIKDEYALADMYTVMIEADRRRQVKENKTKTKADDIMDSYISMSTFIRVFRNIYKNARINKVTNEMGKLISKAWSKVEYQAMERLNSDKASAIQLEEFQSLTYTNPNSLSCLMLLREMFIKSNTRIFDSCLDSPDLIFIPTYHNMVINIKSNNQNNNKNIMSISDITSTVNQVFNDLLHHDLREHIDDFEAEDIMKLPHFSDSNRLRHPFSGYIYQFFILQTLDIKKANEKYTNFLSSIIQHRSNSSFCSWIVNLCGLGTHSSGVLSHPVASMWLIIALRMYYSLVHVVRGGFNANVVEYWKEQHLSDGFLPHITRRSKKTLINSVNEAWKEANVSNWFEGFAVLMNVAWNEYLEGTIRLKELYDSKVANREMYHNCCTGFSEALGDRISHTHILPLFRLLQLSWPLEDFEQEDSFMRVCALFGIYDTVADEYDDDFDSEEELNESIQQEPKSEKVEEKVLKEEKEVVVAKEEKDKKEENQITKETTTPVGEKQEKKQENKSKPLIKQQEQQQEEAQVLPVILPVKEPIQSEEVIPKKSKKKSEKLPKVSQSDAHFRARLSKKTQKQVDNLRSSVDSKRTIKPHKSTTSSSSLTTVPSVSTSHSKKPTSSVSSSQTKESSTDAHHKPPTKHAWQSKSVQHAKPIPGHQNMAITRKQNKVLEQRLDALERNWADYESTKVEDDRKYWTALDWRKHAEMLENGVAELDLVLSQERVAQREAEESFEREREDWKRQQNKARVHWAGQLETSEKKLFQMELEVRKLRAGSIDVNYREMLANGGKIDETTFTKEQMAKVEKEFKELDMLIQGLNKENERLVEETRILRATHKGEQEGVFKENREFRSYIQDLKAEVAKLSRQLELKPMGNPDSMEEIRILNREIDIMSRQKIELMNDLEKQKQLRIESELKSTGLTSSRIFVSDNSMITDLQLKMGQKDHTIQELEKKIAFYVENQKIIDNYETDKRKSDSQIIELNSYCRELQKHVPRHVIRKLKENPFANEVERGHGKEQLRIKQLTKEVKELEGLLAKRQQNSVAAVIRAAKPTLEESEIIDMLRKENKQLSAELTQKDKDVILKIRSLRQEHEKLKAMYESRIEALNEKKETEKAQKTTKKTKKNPRVIELEKQVADLRAYYMNKLNAVSKEKENKPSVETVTTTIPKKTSTAKQNELKNRIHMHEATIKKQEKKITELEDLLDNVSIQLDALRGNYASISMDKKKDNIKQQNNTSQVSQIPVPSDVSEHYAQSPARVRQPKAHPHPKRGIPLSSTSSSKISSTMHSKILGSSSPVKNNESIQTLKMNMQEAHQREIRRLNLSHQEHLQSITQPLEDTIKRLENDVTRVREDSSLTIKQQNLQIENLQAQVHQFIEKMKQLEEINVNLTHAINEQTANPTYQHYSKLLGKIQDMENRYEERESQYQQAAIEAQNSAEVERFHFQEKIEMLKKSQAQKIRTFQNRLDQLLNAIASMQQEERNR